MKRFVGRQQRKNWLRLVVALSFVLVHNAGPLAALALNKEEPSGFLRSDPDGNPARWNPCARLKWKLVGAGISGVGRDAVSSAVKSMMLATGLVFTYEEGGLASDLRAQLDDTLVIGLAPKNVNTRVAGTTRVKYDVSLPRVIRIASATITLNPDIFRHRSHSFNFVMPVLLHELGHSVGLSHVADPADIMYPKIVNRVQYQQSDIVKLARVGASNGCVS